MLDFFRSILYNHNQREAVKTSKRKEEKKMNRAYRELYCYWVEYVDVDGTLCSDSWSKRTLEQELHDGIVKILSAVYMDPDKEED